MKPVKPWLSLDGQIQKIQDRGLLIDHRSSAIDYLKRVGYYRLSGYWYPFRIMDKTASIAEGRSVRSDVFLTGSRFEDVVRLYVFDKKLRLLALDALERIEMSVRVEVAHLLGQRDPFAHENPACLHGNFTKKPIPLGTNKGKTQHQVWLAKYQAMLKRASKEPFVVHHQQMYGAMPIWAAIEVWDFGLLSKLFAGMQHADQQTIAAMYGVPSGKIFAQWLRSLNFIRNVSAHHNRLWNLNILERSSALANWPIQLDNARPFFYFCLMQQLLLVICPNSSWGQRFKNLLKNGFPVVAHQAISLSELGAFTGWDEWAPWLQT